jgi:hypothetical protein
VHHLNKLAAEGGLLPLVPSFKGRASPGGSHYEERLVGIVVGEVECLHEWEQKPG